MDQEFYEKRLTIMEELNLKLRAERDAAERNLACIADMLNTWAREMNQREVTDYLGPCVLRDALKELSGYANKREYELRAQLSRWPEAVAKVRGRYPETAFPPDGKSVDCNSARMARLVCDEITRLATERKEEADGE